MGKINEILQGYKIYPKLNDKYIKLSIAIDMEENYKFFFGNIDYEEFISKIKNNKKYHYEVISKIVNYFKLDGFKVITSNDYHTWYFIKLLDKINNNYSMLYVENLCQLNLNNFFENYIDLFGNEIMFNE